MKLAPSFFLPGLFLLGCSTGRMDRQDVRADARLEVLTSFSMALSKRDFNKAIGYLADSERQGLLGPDGVVPADIQERLRALEISTLYKDPAIKVSHRRISGIAGSLPVLEQAAPKDSSQSSVTGTGLPSPPLEEPVAAGQFMGDEPLRKATQVFFRTVQTRQWKKALAYLDEGERAVFMQRDGSLRQGTRRRLLAADTSAWDALSLKDGKLTGVVLILPSLSAVTNPGIAN